MENGTYILELEAPEHLARSSQLKHIDPFLPTTFEYGRHDTSHINTSHRQLHRISSKMQIDCLDFFLCSKN